MIQNGQVSCKPQVGLAINAIWKFNGVPIFAEVTLQITQQPSEHWMFTENFPWVPAFVKLHRKMQPTACDNMPVRFWKFVEKHSQDVYYGTKCWIICIVYLLCVKYLGLQEIIFFLKTAFLKINFPYLKWLSLVILSKPCNQTLRWRINAQIILQSSHYPPCPETI